jgi:DNA-binding transcriptional LysR family regulator
MLDDHPVNPAANRIDVAVRVGELPDSSLIAARVGLIRNLVCACPEYLKEHGSPKIPQEIVDHDCINFTFAALMAPDVWTFRAGKSEMSLRIHSRFVVNTAKAAIDAAIAGAGIARVLSYQVKRAIQTGALISVLNLTRFEPAPTPINVIHTSQGLLPLKLRAFLDFAMPRLRNALK